MREIESPPFESLIPDSETVSVPIKELDHTAPPIAEHKQGTRKRVLVQFRTDQSAQAVEGFPHVAWRTVEIDSSGGGQG